MNSSGSNDYPVTSPLATLGFGRVIVNKLVSPASRIQHSSQVGSVKRGVGGGGGGVDEREIRFSMRECIG
jgi:hypothetical protein